MGSHLKDDGNDISPSTLDDALYNNMFDIHDTYILVSNPGIDVVIDVDSCHLRLRYLSIGRFSLRSTSCRAPNSQITHPLFSTTLKRPTENCCTHIGHLTR
ncbi:hypothetical protein M378DRAFT_160959 [Amanita muscaria Koide BX008]|uniref:Uncharacterized protein n=1 Tax=Amanita muscaria (strain Koide BX008) TaxID=946122 RepID=A0A0C2XC94_AMAMK|nr:hypothetical protein M378DRAFT_160959 [Amanita muscaria Koide BX008]